MLLPLLLLSLLLTGCASAPVALPPTLAVPTGFAEAPEASQGNGAALPVEGRWWQVFGEPTLDSLIAQAMAGNTGLQQAAARLAQAQALAQAAGSERRPTLGLDAGASRQGGPLINAAGGQGTLFSGALTASWELDLAGRLSRNADAALLDAHSRQALLQAAQLSVQAELVANWFSLQALEDERAVLQSIAQSAQASLQLQQGRRAAGLAPEQQLAQARAEAAAAQAQVLALAPRRAELRHALAYLAGQHVATAQAMPWPQAGAMPGAPAQRQAQTPSQPPSQAEPQALPMAAWAPGALPSIPAGIPSQVLARRPDVAAAEHALQAAALRLGVAQDAWLPQIQLTASGGLASPDLGDLLKTAARSWGLGALLALPLIDGGRREAGIAVARAELQAAAAAWREQMLVALREVEDRLALIQGLAAQAGPLQAVHDDAARSAVLAASRRANGLASQLDVLEAERAVLRERRALQQLQAARRLASVGLVRALGGGWGAPNAPVQHTAWAWPAAGKP